MDGVVDLGIIGENVLEEELLSRRAGAKTRATSPCAVSTSAAAACRWRLRWMKHGTARRRWTANVSPPLTRTC